MVGVFGVVSGVIYVVLGALGDKKVEMAELAGGGAGLFQGRDDLDEELLELLAGNWADFEII